MFEALMDEVSKLFSWQWPIAQGEITVAEIERIHDNEALRLSVTYKFSIGDDGPYSGEAYWQPKFSIHLVEKMRTAKKQMFVGRPVEVRYRPSDPSVNRLDGGVARYLEN